MNSDVVMINRALAVAITEDGQELTIVAAFDDDGDDCDLNEAVACAAGPDKDGKWLSIDLRSFNQQVLQ